MPKDKTITKRKVGSMSKSKKIVKKTASQIAQLKKDKFVEAYEKTNGNITDSASIAGISRRTYYNWLDADKEFAMQILDAEADLNDEIRQVLISKAADGDMTAVIFYLKNRHPDFKQGDTNVAVQVNVQPILTEKMKAE